MSEEQLIFIISQPRAGSTYLQRLLSNNDEVNTTSEPWLMLKLASLFKPDLCSAQFNFVQTNNAYNEFVSQLGSNLDLDSEVKNLAMKHYSVAKGTATYFLDKTPRYWEIIDELMNIFPNAQFIILLRNPLDVLKSMIQTWNLDHIEKLENLKRDILLAPEILLKSSIKYEGLENVQVVNYEHLVKNGSSEIARLYKWLGMKYIPEVLEIENNTKIKGSFGDPYQNGKEKKMKNLPNYFQRFTKGYVDFLSETVTEYYQIDRKSSSSTRTFRTFLKQSKNGLN